MNEKFQWRGFSWTVGAEGKCPECGKATLCWRHLYMAERYARLILRLRKEGVEAEK